MSERSNRVANAFRRLGVRRGDRILLMLGNVVPLWECMLAAMKLGAVIVPATTLLTRNDLADRFTRGRVRHVIAGADARPNSPICPATTRASPSATLCRAGHRYEKGYDAPPEFTPDGETHADDPLLLYFTSGTTATPKLVLHSHQSYPVGHLSTMYWLGLRPGDVHLNISSPGWAKHAWSCFFAPWNAQATVFIVNQPRFNARGLLDTVARCGVTTFCAPPTVWRMLIQEDLAAWPVELKELIGAGEPLNPEVIERVKSGLGPHHPRRLRPDRDNGAGRQYAGPEGQARLDGPAAAGLSRRAARSGRRARKEGEICLTLEPRPTGLMQGYQGDDGNVVAARRLGLPHRRRRDRR